MDYLPIRTDVPHFLHRGHLEQYAKKGLLDDGLLAGPRQYYDAAYKYYSLVNDAAASVKPGREAALLATVKNSFGPIEKGFTSRLKQLESAKAAADKKISEAIDDPARNTIAGAELSKAIRDHYAALPKEARYSFVTNAINNGDRQTLSVIFNSPLYLLKDNEDGLRGLRNHAASKLAPEAYNVSSNVAKLIEQMRHDHGLVKERVEQIERKYAPSKKAKSEAALNALAASSAE